jgi:hypothetical protein
LGCAAGRELLHRAARRGAAGGQTHSFSPVSQTLPAPPEPEPIRLSAQIRRYLDQIDTLKKPNIYRKYDAVLKRFDEHFPVRTLETISVEQLNDFVVTLRKSGLSANTVLHNNIIIAQFCRRYGRPNLTRDLQLPEAVHFLPRVYTEEQQSRLLEACDSRERTPSRID